MNWSKRNLNSEDKEKAMPDIEERKKQEIDKIVEAYKEKKSIPEDELLNKMDRLNLEASEM